MSDVFILNIDEEEQEIIEPIAQILESYHISTYCDTEAIYEEGSFAETILKEIKNCLVLALVITENCFESLLSIFDLSSNVIQSDKTTVLPILHNVDIDKATEKYPFLLQCDCITYNENMDDVVSQIKTTVEGLKDITHTKTDIKNFINNLESHKSKNLNFIVERLKVVLNAEEPLAVIKDIYNTVEAILLEIAKKENIYVNSNYILKNIERSGVIEENVQDNIKYIISVNDMYNAGANNYEETKVQKELSSAVSKLGLIIDWYVLSYVKAPLIKHKKIVPVNSDQVTKQHLEDIHNIETLVFSESIVGEADVTKFSFMYNPYSIVAAKDFLTGEIAAFINTYPITEKFYEKILSGNFDDTKITEEDIMKYDTPGFYKLYVSSLCIHPKYNRTTAFGVVYKAFSSMLLHLAKDKDIYISDVIADCATQKGATICESIGMQKSISTSHNTTVYNLKLTKENLNEMKFLTRQSPEILNLYREKYK